MTWTSPADSGAVSGDAEPLISMDTARMEQDADADADADEAATEPAAAAGGRQGSCRARHGGRTRRRFGGDECDTMSHHQLLIPSAIHAQSPQSFHRFGFV